MNSIKDKFDYDFKNKELLTLALTHKSASNNNNERLEFLGDAVLNFFIAKINDGEYYSLSNLANNIQTALNESDLSNNIYKVFVQKKDYTNRNGKLIIYSKNIK